MRKNEVAAKSCELATYATDCFAAFLAKKADPVGASPRLNSHIAAKATAGDSIHAASPLQKSNGRIDKTNPVGRSGKTLAVSAHSGVEINLRLCGRILAATPISNECSRIRQHSLGKVSTAIFSLLVQ
jgi:hypothetical protein